MTIQNNKICYALSGFGGYLFVWVSIIMHKENGFIVSTVVIILWIIIMLIWGIELEGNNE